MVWLAERSAAGFWFQGRDLHPRRLSRAAPPFPARSRWLPATPKLGAHYSQASPHCQHMSKMLIW